MKIQPGKLLTIFISLVFLAYVGYRVFQFFDQPYQTEIAQQYAVQDTLRVNGIAVRNEELIPGEGARGVSYIYEDASKVLKGTDVAYAHASDETLQNSRRIGELEEEIELLREANATANQVYGAADTLNVQLGNALVELAEGAGQRTLGEFSQARSQMLLLLNKKQILTGAVENFDGRIAELEQEKRALEDEIASDFEQTVAAPGNGYFLSTVDGFETALNKENIWEMPVQRLESYIVSVRQYAGDAVGKLADGYEWYFLAPVTGDEAEQFWEGRSVPAAFDGISQEVPLVVEGVLADETSENQIVVFRCDSFSAQLGGLRQSGAELLLSNYSGVRISDEAVRFNEEQQMGVYVVDRGTVRFRTIEILYQGVGYKICKWEQGLSGAIQLYDEVIVKGVELYDGKVVE